jgi:hypothetical protein
MHFIRQFYEKSVLATKAVFISYRYLRIVEGIFIEFLLKKINKMQKCLK